jgi:hypothetical protein
MLHSASVAFLAFYPMAKNNTHKAIELCYTVPQLLFLPSIQWGKNNTHKAMKLFCTVPHMQEVLTI